MIIHSMRLLRWGLLSSAVFLAVVALGVLSMSGLNRASANNQPPAQPPSLSLEKKQFPKGDLYILEVSADAPYLVVPAIAKPLSTIEAPVWKNIKEKSPVFLINGGFFDPNNGLTTSFIFENGVLSGDPRLNPQLIGNAKIQPYLPKIFDRSEFRTYVCRNTAGQFKTRYDIVAHESPIPTDCVMQASIGAGPSLLPKLGDLEEGFVDYDAQGKLIRDPIGVCALNARSVLGLTEQGDVIIVMGAQSPSNPAKTGFSLSDMASLLAARGAVKAIALDGGSSSGLLFEGKPYYGKFNKDGSPVKRPVKSVLMVLPR